MHARRFKTKELDNGTRLVFNTFGPGTGEGMVTIIGSLHGGAIAWGSKYAATIHAEMLSEGTKTMSKDEISRALDDIGATINFSAGSTRLVISAQVRAPHLETVLGLIQHLLSEAVFLQERLEKIQMRMSAELDLAKQDTRTQASIALSRLMFPKGHPNRQETIDEARAVLSKITPKVLAKQHALLLERPALILSISGDTSHDRMFAASRAAFSTWSKRRPKVVRFAKAPTAKRKVLTIAIAEKSSIDYMLAIPSRITAAHADYPALVLGLQILGNPRGFAGRLMKTTREEEGLTYGVYAYASGFDQKTDGSAMIWATFAPELLSQGRASIARQIDTIIREPVAKKELKRHQELFANYRIVQMSTSNAYATAGHSCLVDNLPLSYLDTFPRLLKKVTSSDVARILKKYLDISCANEVAAGPVEKNALTA